jgi:hypothetical protein
MPAALVANLINLGHSEKLMISELEKRITFATRLKFEFENVFVKRLRLCKIINLDRHVIAPIDLNAHTPALCANGSLISMLLTARNAGKRTSDWLKIKARLQQEFVVGGFTAPKGSRKHLGAVVIGAYTGGKLELS